MAGGWEGLFPNGRQTLALGGETMKTGDNRRPKMIQKIFLVVWVVLLAGLLCMIGYILLDGSTVHRKSLAEDLAILWALSFGVWAYLTWKARQ